MNAPYYTSNPLSPAPLPTVPPTHPPTGSSNTMERLSKPCLHAPNCRRPANAFCKNSSCKSCCLKHNGGCDQVRGHRAANFQPRHTLAPGPSLFHSQESQPTSSFSESLTPFGIDRDLTFDSFAESIRQGNPVLRLKEECASQAAAEQQAALHEAQLEAQVHCPRAGQGRAKAIFADPCPGPRGWARLS